MSKYAAALDFGSSKVALAVGEQTPGGVRIVSYHDAPAAGIECGEIVNDFKVKEIVASLLRQAEEDILEPISTISVGLSGRVLHSKDLPCQITRTDSKAYITKEEVRQITRTRYKASLENDETVFEAVPQKYSTEDRIGITQDELIGMVGSQIDADFKIFYGRKSILSRRITVLEECGITLGKAILAPIASARAVLTKPEMENGVALVDIGKNTTEVAIIKDNIVRQAAIIPFGGESVTTDIKTVTNITREWAETIKLLHGRCCEEYAVENKKLVLKNESESSDGEVEVSLLVRTVEARLSEIFDAVRYVIEQSGYAAKITSGVVITGGASHHEDLIQLAGALLGQKIRLAAPASIDKDSVDDAFDVYASTVVGLVQETLDPMLSHAIEYKADEPAAAPSTANTSLFNEADEPEEDRLSAREERERRREEERKAKEIQKQQETLRKQQEAQRKAEEKARKKAEKENQPSFFDMFFSKDDKA